MSKGLIERPAQHILTAVSGPRAEALALVLPDSELPAFWTLHLDDINWTQPTEGDKGGLSWDSNPDPGGGHHGWRRGRSGTCAVDPTSRARYTGRNVHNHNINTIISMFHIRYLVSVLLQCSENASACEQYAEDLGFEIRLHLFWTLISIGMNWYVLVCTRMYQYVPVWTSMYRYIHVCTGMYQYVLVYTCRLQYIPVCTSTHIHLLVCSSMYLYELSRMNQYILVHTSIYSDFLCTNAFISRYSIHHGTRQYNEVPKSPVYLDYDGTTR